MATVLVTGVGGPAGHATALLLLGRGYRVVGADLRPITLPGVSCHQVPAAADPGFFAALHGLAADVRADLVIPTVTEELPVLAAMRPGWEVGTLAIGPYQAIVRANDKYQTCTQLAGQGVSTPRFALPSQLADRAAVEQRLGWPCLSKPRVSRGGRGVRLHTRAEWPPEPAFDDSTLLQEFAPGTEYAPNLYLGRSSITVVVLEKTRLKEGLVGNALEVRRVDAPDVAAVAFAACHALGLRGVADVDVRRRADGVPVVLEVNARLGANVAHAPDVLDAMLAEARLC